MKNRLLEIDALINQVRKNQTFKDTICFVNE